MDSIQNMALVMGAAGFMGLLIGVVYKYSHSRAIYASQMIHSLVIYAVLTAMMLYLRITVSTAVLLGAVSILRFRNPIKDHRDLVYILWSVISGFCCATHMFSLLGVGSVLIVIMLMLFKATKQYDRVLLAVKSKDKDDESIIKQLDDLYLSNKLKMIENNSVGDISSELIYEVKETEGAFKTAENIKEKIYEHMPDVTEIIVMYQEDDTAI
ncbi:MAG: DUF4956 domain-containing protein [Butyrivibrio sp.]|nr:DUF4956 domain-containing protein [Butyrivibrio sp.]